jgi:hypothetical protein
MIAHNQIIGFVMLVTLFLILVRIFLVDSWKHFFAILTATLIVSIFLLWFIIGLVLLIGH